MSKAQRQAQLAELRRAQQSADRRRRRLVIVVGALAAAALVIPAAVIITGEQRRQAEEEAALQEAVGQPLPGVVEVPEQEATHVLEDVDYGTLLPPSGGAHDPVWQDCGFYDAPVRNENAVHSLEHGAVWIAYSESLPDDDVSDLRDLTDEHSYLLVSPYPELSGPLVATAWGVQLELDGVDDERLDVFIARYLQGPQTPEPGAACSDGTAATI
jgi:hypothetical protein